MADTKHDFKDPIEKTSTELAKVVLQQMLANVDKLIYPYKEFTDEEEKQHDEETTDFAIKITQLIGATDLPGDYASYPIDKIQTFLNVLKNYVDGTVRQVKDEIMSRTLGVKSPRTDTYAQDVATMADLMMTLNAVREKTGNNPDDYFIKSK